MSMFLNRRLFLQASGSAAAGCLWPRALFAAPSDELPAARAGKVLVLVYLRGGADGLGLVVPFGDPGYAPLRRSTAIAAPGRGAGAALDLDGTFGLHPRAAALAPRFADGSAACVHALGSPLVTRSHFEDQDWSETLLTSGDVSSEGFLNRHLATTRGDGVVRALSIGESLPRSLRGEARTYALAGLDDLVLEGGRGGEAMLEALRRAYGVDGEEAAQLTARGGQATLEVLRELRAVAQKPYEARAEYPAGGLGPRLREAARLIRADIGVELICLDYQGWDTHLDQGGAQGAFGNLVEGLAAPLAAFATDLGAKLDDVLVLTVTEFGRTARENGTGGTDHGWASCALALGGPVRAARGARDGPVLGRWPGLAHDELHEGRDLLHTTDVRDLWAEAIGGHLGNPALEAVLGGYEPQRVGLLPA